jgi:hypothetical protein
MALGEASYNDTCAARVHNGLTSLQWDAIIDSGMTKFTTFINENRGPNAGLLHTPGELAYATLYRRYRKALASHEERPVRAYRKKGVVMEEDDAQSDEST